MKTRIENNNLESLATLERERESISLFNAEIIKSFANNATYVVD